MFSMTADANDAGCTVGHHLLDMPILLSQWGTRLSRSVSTSRPVRTSIFASQSGHETREPGPAKKSRDEQLQIGHSMFQS